MGIFSRLKVPQNAINSLMQVYLKYRKTAHYLASIGHEACDLLPTITAPLVIHGSEDQVNRTAIVFVRITFR